MRKSFIVRTILIIFCILAFCSQMTAGENVYSVAGRLDVPSLMKLSENFGKLGDKIAPGMGNNMVMLTIGLSMNPEFCDFDMTAPLSIILLANSNDPEQKEINLCILAMKKRRTVQSTVKIASEIYTTKDIGEYAAVCSSKKIVDNLDFSTLSMPPKDGVGTLTLSLNMQTAMKNFSFASFMMARIYGHDPSKDGMPSEKEMDEMKESKLIFDQADLLLKQLETLQLTLSPDQNQIMITLKAKAAGKSAFEAFIRNQEISKMSVPETVFEGAETFAVMSLSPSNELKQSLSDMLAEMSIETTSGSDREANSHSKFYEAVFKASTGNACLSAGMQNSTYLSKAIISVDPAKMPELEKLIEKREKTPFDGTWILEKNKDSEKGTEGGFFCTIDKKNPGKTVFFTAPTDSPEGFFKMLSDKNAMKLPKLKTEGSAIAVFNLKRIQGKPDAANMELAPFLTVKFDRTAGTVNLDLMLDPADFASTQPLFKHEKKKAAGQLKFQTP